MRIYKEIIQGFPFRYLVTFFGGQIKIYSLGIVSRFLRDNVPRGTFKASAETRNLSAEDTEKDDDKEKKLKITENTEKNKIYPQITQS